MFVACGSPPKLSTMPFMQMQCIRQAFEDHTLNVQLFFQVLLPLRQLLLVLTFLSGCSCGGVSSCLGKGKPVNCRFVGPFYFYAPTFLAARSKRARQTIACSLLGSGVCKPEKKTQQFLEGVVGMGKQLSMRKVVVCSRQELVPSST